MAIYRAQGRRQRNAIFSGRSPRTDIEYRFRGRFALAMKPAVKAFDRMGYALFNCNKEFARPLRLRSLALVQPSGLGDILMTLPTLNVLKQKFGLRIVLAVPSGAVAWMRSCTFVDEVVALDLPFLAKRGKPNRPGYIETIRKLRAVDADVIYEVRGDMRLSMLLRLGRNGKAVGGMGCGGGGFLFDRLLDFNERFHSFDFYRAVLKDIGFADDPLRDWTPDLVPLDSPGFLPETFLAVHVGTGWTSKQWPRANFLALIERLSRSVPVVVLGASGDLDASEHAALARLSDCIDMVGKFDFAQTLGAIAQARAYVGQDTGATHGAALLGVPYVSLYSGVDASRFLPVNLFERQGRIIQHRPICSGPHGCARRVCENNICMTDITVEVVETGVREKLATPVPSREQWHPAVASGTPWRAPPSRVDAA